MEYTAIRNACGFPIPAAQFLTPEGHTAIFVMESYFSSVVEKSERIRTDSRTWVANKRFVSSTFKFKFPRARNLEIIGLVLGWLAGW